VDFWQSLCGANRAEKFRLRWLILLSPLPRPGVPKVKVAGESLPFDWTRKALSSRNLFGPLVINASTEWADGLSLSHPLPGPFHGLQVVKWPKKGGWREGV